jgi:hypothetical protein
MPVKVSCTAARHPADMGYVEVSQSWSVTLYQICHYTHQPVSRGISCRWAGMSVDTMWLLIIIANNQCTDNCISFLCMLLRLR